MWSCLYRSLYTGCTVHLLYNTHYMGIGLIGRTIANIFIFKSGLISANHRYSSSFIDKVCVEVRLFLL